MKNSKFPPPNIWQREKFGQLIFMRIIEIVVTRCQILRLKCTKLELSRNAEASDLQVY